jgi:hypothetical protein
VYRDIYGLHELGKEENGPFSKVGSCHYSQILNKSKSGTNALDYFG